MPRAAISICNYPGCNELTHARYCEKHAKAYDKARGSAAQRGYNSLWRKIRNRKLRLTPLCEICEAEGEVRPATIVHHKDRNPENNSEGNLVSVCPSHHDQIHHEEKFGRENKLM